LLNNLPHCETAECAALEVEISPDDRDYKNDSEYCKRPADYFFPIHDCS